jgi:predicted glycoside hydrolase/deacetylase ChbG (UPF0249 family)
LSGRRLLVVNADDFGFTRDVNQGIVEAHLKGILTAATLAANGPAFEDAVSLAHKHPTLDVGCHLVLVEGRSMLPPCDPLPRTVSALVWAVTRRRIRIYEELAAQVRKILSAGITPTHLDTHKHTHLLPPVLEAVARVAEEFHIPWVRRPLPMDLFEKRLHGALERHGCRTTDHFAGFRMTGRFGTKELVQLIRRLPAGTTEFMCHPGRCGAELRLAPTRLKESRQHELETLIAPETRQAVQDSQIRVVSYREL